MQTKKIVITGGPGTGKSSIIKKLEAEGHKCFPEISREVILEAKKKGIEQLFLEDPLLFSKMLLEGRINQYEATKKVQDKIVYLDRGIPDVIAYLDYVEAQHPPVFQQSCKDFLYDQIFLLPPWEEIYQSDNERYETFEEAVKIHHHLSKTYSDLGYNLVEVPKDTIENRTFFILEKSGF